MLVSYLVRRYSLVIIKITIYNMLIGVRASIIPQKYMKCGLRIKDILMPSK